MADKYLFIFTIGPVQSFIAQARKTHDLYAGSLILSKLIRKAINTIGRKNVIFPFTYPEDEQKWNEIESLPNRFLAIVDNPKIGTVIEAAVNDYWESLANTAINKAIFDKISSGPIIIDYTGMNEQINHHLEIFWAFELLENSYSLDFATVERKLGAMKNVRVFSQYKNGIHFGEQGRKCSIDGQRNVKFYRKSIQQNTWTDTAIQDKYLFANHNCIFDYGVSSNLAIRFLQPGEGLSAVSFVKRSFMADEEFESTATIALLNWINCLSNKSKQSYKKRFRNDFNDQLYFDENLNTKYLEKQGVLCPDIEQAMTDLKQLKEEAKGCEQKQSKYYALLAFDGDNMGEWLSKAISADEHSQFSKLLIDFAQKAKKIIDAEAVSFFRDGKEIFISEKQRGRTVYAGGDDFLGFINLNDLFDVLADLKTLFDSEVAAHVPITNNGQSFSFSAGVCIAHYKEPLSLVISRAKEMEEKAKTDYQKKGKNAFGISIIKSSGDEHEMTLSFEHDNLINLKELTLALYNEETSNTFIKNFDRTFAWLIEHNKQAKSLFNIDLLKTEFTRLMLRGVKEKYKQHLKDISSKIWQSFEKEDRNNFENFIAVLNTCNFIHRHLSKTEIKNANH